MPLDLKTRIGCVFFTIVALSTLLQPWRGCEAAPSGCTRSLVHTLGRSEEEMFAY